MIEPSPPRKMLLLLPLLAAIVSSHAQMVQSKPAPDPLFQTIASLDAALFDAYNTCDLKKFESFFIDDVEFYHDRGGLTLGKKDLTESIKNNICGKVTRELVPGTLEVYPIKDYGAVEIGVHRFQHPKQPSEGVGEAKFIHLWQNKDGAWKITRVISYDHGPAKL